MEEPWFGPAHAMAGAGPSRPSWVPWNPHVVLAPGARTALYGPRGRAVTVVPFRTTSALCGVPSTVV